MGRTSTRLSGDAMIHFDHQCWEGAHESPHAIDEYANERKIKGFREELQLPSLPKQGQRGR